MSGSIASTALNGAKSVLRFIEGSWGKSVGTAYRNARMADPNIGILNFNWGQAYNDHFTRAAQAASAAASQPAATGFFASIKNCLYKIPGMKFIGRNIGPIFMLGPMLIDAAKELFNGGGIGGSLKELTKGAIGWIGWGVGSMIAAACGATGAIIPFLAGIAVSTAFGWIAKKALGPSTSEKTALLEQQKNIQQQTGYPTAINTQTIDIDRQMRDIQRLFDDRNNPFLNPNATVPVDFNRKCFVA